MVVQKSENSSMKLFKSSFRVSSHTDRRMLTLNIGVFLPSVVRCVMSATPSMNVKIGRWMSKSDECQNRPQHLRWIIKMGRWPFFSFTHPFAIHLYLSKSNCMLPWGIPSGSWTASFLILTTTLVWAQSMTPPSVMHKVTSRFSSMLPLWLVLRNS